MPRPILIRDHKDFKSLSHSTIVFPMFFSFLTSLVKSLISNNSYFDHYINHKSLLTIILTTLLKSLISNNSFFLTDVITHLKTL